MEEPGLLGYVSGGDKKGKETTAVPLIIPFVNPSYHLILGGGDSRHEAVFGALVRNAILTGNTVVAFDTTGMVVPFLLPFLPGDHVKKARGLKERVPQSLIENLRPAGVFFNSPVEETSGSAIKGWFSLSKTVLDAARLDAGQQEALRDAFGTSKAALMRDILQSAVTVAFGKDYLKVKVKASSFVDYLLAGFERLAEEGLPYPTWVHARGALFGGNLGVPRPPSLSDKDVDVFGRTLDYYLSNALLFKPPRPGPASMGIERLEGMNFLLFYLQDMDEREQALALALLFAQHAIATVTSPGLPGDPISAALQRGRAALAFDEIGLLFGKVHPVLQPLASSGALFREAAMHRCSLLMASRAPSAVDLDLLENAVLQPALAGDVEAYVCVGRLKEKEGLAGVASWLGGKGARIDPSSIEGLKPTQALLYQLKAPGEPTRFDVIETGVTSADVSPSLLKAMLAAPILVSKGPAAVPARVAEAQPAAPVAPPGEQAPVRQAPPVQEPAPSRPTPAPRPVADAALPETVRPGTAAAPALASLSPPRIQPPVPLPEKTVAVAAPVPAPPERQQGAPVVEELLDQYEPGEAGSDEIGGNKGDVQGDLSSDLDFLSRLLGADKAPAGAGKISRMDYNMALNALLFKLEKVVKASFGVQFFKELMSTKSVPYGRAMEMYYQESNAMLKGKFAVQRGETLAYQGIKEAVRAIIAELGLQIPMPADEEIGQLESALIKALELPRNELLQRIKDGSLYF
ncbi:MAG: hypothetical protein JW839_05205 [Candidatus Lokiarchaeota archaeon]|nr:hypothetical protein [Candidatus Lokiarchaeota archaeon]